MTSFIVMLAVVVALVGVGVVAIVRRAAEMKALAEDGRVTRGRVVGRRKRSRRKGVGQVRRIQLAHERPDSGEHRRWITANSSQWEALQDGTEVELVYLPEKPGVFAMLAMVNDARRARGLEPLSH